MDQRFGVREHMTETQYMEVKLYISLAFFIFYILFL